ncbi:hypothetical protein NDU88_004353 [Pleurodeles waltl]|uniref:Uncharacterized protein n=1 Tax=Pleurodeles waltl TaxID=8319 RepID=A0AAV7NN72_PLEWA|nr:hypothetical protein NDU88_004353 [Pleurodeles waltl]
MDLFAQSNSRGNPHQEEGYAVSCCRHPGSDLFAGAPMWHRQATLGCPRALMSLMQRVCWVGGLRYR